MIRNKLYPIFILCLIVFVSSCSDDTTKKNIDYPDTSDLSGKYQSTIKHALDGNVKAQMDIAYAYMDGDGVPVDNDKVIAWLKHPAESGNDEAQFNLAVIYFNEAKKGKGEPYFKKSFYWNSKQANKNDKDAQYNVAIMYDDGLGIKKNDKKAFEWHLKAAKNGHAVSQRNVGSYYVSGDAVEINKKQAFIWFEKAARNGEPDSMFFAGRRYFEGKVVKKDPIKAYQWMKLSLFVSKESGSANETAQDRRAEFQKLKATMTKEQIQQGDQWVKSKTGH